MKTSGKLYSTLLLAGFTAVGANFAVAAESEEIEEVVVTGSYLKRTAADSPSPLTVIDAASISEIAASDVQEIMRQLPYQSGTQTRAQTFGGGGSQGRVGINLRNLGAAATLTLVNGRRHVTSFYDVDGNGQVDANSLIPNIMISRVEIVKDGASALYGSDAIAGVVNFLVDDDFEGFNISTKYEVDEETREGDTYDISAKIGAQGDRGGFVMGASYLQRDRIETRDRFNTFGGAGVSSTGNPGRFPLANPAAPVQFADANGNGTGVFAPAGQLPRGDGTFGQRDLDCEQIAVQDGEGGALGAFGDNICIYDFSTFFSQQEGEVLTKVYTNAHYDLTDNLRIFAEGGYSEQEFQRFNSLAPGGRGAVIPANVANIDPRLAALGITGNPGLIADARRRGIVPVDLINGTRLQGGTATTPFTEQVTDPRTGATGTVGRRPLVTQQDSDRDTLRFVGGVEYDFEFNGRPWTMYASLTSAEVSDVFTRDTDTNADNLNAALNGLGGPNCDVLNGTPGDGNASFAQTGNFLDGNCYFFNPFGNTLFADGNGTAQTDLILQNPPELFQDLDGGRISHTQIENRVVDIVFAGELFDLPAGPLGLAAGFQRRDSNLNLDFDVNTRLNNQAFIFGASNATAELTANTGFFELSVPVTETLEANLAVRYESFEELGANSTDPKLSVLWRPADDWSFRGSVGTSFRVGSLLQLFGTQTIVANTVDNLTGSERFFPIISSGNPDLEPETAFNWNVGFSWEPTDGMFEGLTVDIDHWSYKYEDLIVKENFQDVINRDSALRQAAGQTIACDGTAGLPNQVIRNTACQAIRILPNFINANELKASGFDLSMKYDYEMDELGLVTIGTQAAWIRKYDIDLETRTIDGVGSLNNDNVIGQPLPEWKVNWNINWTRDRHNLFTQVRLISAVERQGAQSAFRERAVTLAGSRTVTNPNIERTWRADMFYTYQLPAFGPQPEGSTVTVGVRNVTDEEPPADNDSGGLVPQLHDPRGRLWFVRYNVSL